MRAFTLSFSISRDALSPSCFLPPSEASLRSSLRRASILAFLSMRVAAVRARTGRKTLPYPANIDNVERAQRTKRACHAMGKADRKRCAVRYNLLCAAT